MVVASLAKAKPAVVDGDPEFVVAAAALDCEDIVLSVMTE
jgi:hypothetical protein